MYVPYRLKGKIKYVILIVAVAAIIPLLIFGLRKVLEYRSGASPTIRPEEVRVTDITDTSVTISWVTPNDSVEGYIVYGTTDNLDKFSRDFRDSDTGEMGKYNTHYVVIDGLGNGSKYNYKIVSASKKFGDQAGDSFVFTTLGADAVGLSAPKPIYGLSNASNSMGIIYLNLENGDGVKSNVLSTLTNEEGQWEIDLSRIRSEDGMEKFTYTNETKMTIVGMGGNLGGASVIATVGASPVDLSLTFTSGFEVKDLLAESSGKRTEDEGEEVDDSGGTTDPGTDSPPVTTTPVDSDESDLKLSERSIYKDLDWSALISDFVITTVMTEGEDTVTGIDSVKLSNISPTRFTVSWISDNKEIGTLVYGDAMDSLTENAYDDRDNVATQNEYFTHHITVSNLDIGGTYYFSPISGGETYADTPLNVDLYAIQDTPPELVPFSGNISGVGEADSLVYFSIVDNDEVGSDGSSTLLSTVIAENGSWTLGSLGEAFISTGSNYFNATDDDIIQVEAITLGDEDKCEVNYNQNEELVDLSLDNYGNIQTGSEINNLRPLSQMSGSPKTAHILKFFNVILLSLLVVLLGIFIYPKSSYTKWEKRILSIINNYD